ncbi:o-succinylbenzoate synthase [Lysinibacillus sp. 54212]|uniref:o-succinylbenzoate synthase n=1 Tax=Lysinibacillus sp. 54212 TaxID=3119829 RepID=UPI002FC9E13B
MKITEVSLYTLEMRMKQPFETSFGTLQDKTIIVVRAKDESGLVGWGEGVAFDAPWYTEETVKTTMHMLKDFLIPIILHKELQHPDEVSKLFSAIRRNNMAKSAIEGAVWDIYARHTHQSLAQAIGGTQQRIDVGISIGIQPSIEKLLHVIAGYLEEGYKRIKVKIKPGWDVEVISAIRDRFGDIPLMADANSAYTLDDVELLKQLDAFHLMMIEQPLAHDDIVDHAILQKQLRTPICLDESITSLEDARRAIELGSCSVINIKIGRVGGITEAKKIHDYCAEKNIPVWCGGMLEAGIGRAHNIALTSLSNFVMPGDTAASSRYWHEDIITPEVMVDTGTITVPTIAGIGYKVNRELIESMAKHINIIK